MNFQKMTLKRIAYLNIACHYWEMAKSYFGSPYANDYYAKAYDILKKEMGNNNPITLELKRDNLTQ